MKIDRVKTIVFDVGNVLVRVNWGEFGYFLRSRGVSFSNESEFREIVPICAYERGNISTEQFFARISARSIDGFAVEEAEVVWLRMLSPDNEALSVARDMSKTYQVGILSNTSEMQWEYLVANMGIDKFATWVIPSYKYGMLKPEAEIYAKAEELAGVSGREILFIDDREENIAGAEDFGWQVVRYRGVEDLREIWHGK